MQWLAKHEEFIPNPFYVGGHSYTGKIVPPLVQEISKGNVWFCDISPQATFSVNYFYNI